MDLRLTLRALRAQPGYTAAVVVTLALAIGANSAIFSAVHAILLKPMPIADPADLVIAWETDRAHHLAVVELTYQTFDAWASQNRSFTSATAIGSSTWPDVLQGRGDPLRISTAGVSASFFDTLGVRPAIGRTLTADDDRRNAAPVAVLSHRLWTTRFGADPQVIGTTIQTDGRFTVVGVMPEDFDYPRGTDVWFPLVPILVGSVSGKTDGLRDIGVLFVVGRLRPGVTALMARDDLDRLSAALQEKGAIRRFGAAVVVTPFLDHLLGPVRQALWALLAAVLVLLAIGCANVSGLMLTRVSLRRRERAIRLALGATRARLGSQWLLETLVLSVIGGCLGLIASRWIASGIVALAPDDIPRLSEVGINLPVALFTFAAVVVTAVLCGAGPIREAGASNLVDSLNDAARGTPGKHAQRGRSLLLVFQMALTIVLLVAAGLVVRSFVNLRNLDLGFEPSNTVTISVSPRDPRPTANEWIAELLRRISAMPGVDAAGAVYLRPLALGPIGQETAIRLEGQPDNADTARRNPNLNYQIATPGYFKAMNIRLLEGRLFDDRDTANSPRVTIVGASAARRFWPNGGAVGERVMAPTHARDGAPSAWRTVVGVVSDVRYRGLDDVRLDMYDAALQAALPADDLVVRTSEDIMKIAPAIQAEARRMDSGVVFDGITTLDAIVGRAAAPWRFSVWMFTLFAALAFLLATVGLFSLVSLDIANRRHEFAVRIALGASRRDVLRSVLLSAAVKVVSGVAIGVLAAAAGTRALRAILFGVDVLDLPTYAAVLGIVVLVVAIAAYIPARRAADIDPLVLLRRGV